MHNISAVVNLQIIWLCKKISDTQWAEPIKKRFNIVVANSDAEIAAFGADYKNHLRVVDTNDKIKALEENDRAYYDKKPTIIHNPTQNKPEDANYIVEILPMGTKNIKTVYLKKITGK